MECPRCLMDDAIQGITVRGHQCNVCDAHDVHEAQPRDVDRLLYQMRGKYFDCVLGISGGLDSSWLTMWAAEHTDLCVLLVHFDNWFNVPEANRNVERVAQASGFPLVRVYSDERYVQACRALLRTGLPDVDIANDLAMATIVLDVAKQYGIRWTANGHQYRHEGWNPIGWTYMDGRYLRSICGDVPRYMDFGLMKQFRGIKQARFYDHLPPMEYDEMRADLFDWCGWEWYGAKHAENLYTEWVGSWVLPVLHGIDKRLNYLSADIRVGRRTKAEAREVLAVAPTFPPEKWAGVAKGLHFENPAALEAYCRAVVPTLDRSRFPSYRTVFRRARPLIWAAVKAGMASKSFYRKYCKAD